jgi:hypothetical protein
LNLTVNARRLPADWRQHDIKRFDLSTPGARRSTNACYCSWNYCLISVNAFAYQLYSCRETAMSKKIFVFLIGSWLSFSATAADTYTVDKYAPALADDVKITIQIEAVKD